MLKISTWKAFYRSMQKKWVLEFHLRDSMFCALPGFHSLGSGSDASCYGRTIIFKMYCYLSMNCNYVLRL